LPVFTHTLLLRSGEVIASGQTDEILTETNLSAFFQQPVSIQVHDGRTRIALKRTENISIERLI